MTSNAGTGREEISVGFNAENHASIAELDVLSDYFKPEFLNRFDAIVNFNQLTEEHLLQIVDLMLDELKGNLKERKLYMTVTDNAKKELARLGYSPKFGARPLRRVIQDKIEDQLTDLILEADDPIENVLVDLVDGEITMKEA